MISGKNKTFEKFGAIWTLGIVMLSRNNVTYKNSGGTSSGNSKIS